MSSNCSGGCEGCKDSSCKENRYYKLYKESRIKKIYAVVSGKGGVGKSSTTALLASALSRQGHKVAILDADITGPSIAKVFGISDKAVSNGEVTLPAITKTGIQVISTNMLLDDDETPVVWRAPLITGLIKQFYEEVFWDDVDYMFVDMPPGTGDVTLTVLQSLPVDGVIMVTSPQDLVSMIVGKSVNMVNMMNVPIIGIIENMSYVECDECGHKMYVFGESHAQEFADKHQLKLLAQLPLNINLAKESDRGSIENIQLEAIDNIVKEL